VVEVPRAIVFGTYVGEAVQEARSARELKIGLTTLSYILTTDND